MEYQSKTVDSFRWCPRVTNKELDTESDMEETRVTDENNPPTEVKVMMQKMEQMELQLRNGDVETLQLWKELQEMKKKE